MKYDHIGESFLELLEYHHEVSMITVFPSNLLFNQVSKYRCISDWTSFWLAFEKKSTVQDFTSKSTSKETDKTFSLENSEIHLYSFWYFIIASSRKESEYGFAPILL